METRDESSTLAALTVIARHYGINFEPAEVRRNFALADIEPTGEQLAGIGHELGLEIKPLTVQWKELPRLRKILPAILRLDDGTALLLEAVNREGVDLAVVVRDPRAGADVQAVVNETQLSTVWSGEVILVKRYYSFADDERPFGFSWLTARIIGERKLFTDIIATAFINVLFALTPVIVARVVLDKVLAGHSYATLLALSVIFFAILILEAALIFLRQRFLEAITTRVDGKLNLYILEKLVRLPLDYFERNSVGAITHRLFQTAHIRTFLTGEMFATLLDLITAVFLVPILFVIAWQLACFVMLWTTIIFLIVLAFLKPLKERHHRIIAAELKKHSYLTETVYGMRTIKSLSLENRRRLGWDPRVAQVISTRFDLGRMGVTLKALTAPFERLIHSGSLLIGGGIYLYYYYEASQAQTSKALALGYQTAESAALTLSFQPGLLIAFVILAGQVVSPIVRCARLLLEIQEVRAAVTMIATVVNVTPEETRAGTGLRLPIRGNISFQSLRFRYSGGAPLALDDVTFSIPTGTVVGIMGRSGSGKTTITRLLQGLNSQYEGIIKVDGMDLREIDLQYLRTNIGVVAQENFLFTGTIRENIGMARPDASMADIVRAAQLAGAEEFIEKLPQGYNTVLEEGATNLSGGQRQRLAIARALILDPPVLILDEATSALDAESEAIINANLRRIAEGRTIICVSHRLSMLVTANQILVMEKGKLYDKGTHEELLQRCDIYKHMWYQQNRHLDPGTAHGPLAIVHSAQA